MRLAKSSRTLLPLALSAVLATCTLAQEHPNVQPNAVREQLTAQSPGVSQPPSAPQTPAPPPGKRSGPATAKAAAKAPAAAKGSAKLASGKLATPSAEKPAEAKSVARRDPFDTLLTKAR